ncbi:MAG: metallophosphoesterase [Clostridia bacterium]|nr:metallophosphoesterase [Clostridia bacterium]
MKVFAISDLHLSINNSKPMDIFGPVWDNYLDTILEDWNKKVTDEDIVLLAGDLSWAMKLEDAVVDLEFLNKLKGKKVLLRGNHDYWWSTISKVRSVLPKNVYAIQNDCLEIGDYIFCGSRGWIVDESKRTDSNDKKIFDRELIRLEMSLTQAKQKQTSGKKIICLMHYPPFDKNNQSTLFTDMIERFGIDTVVYGHLHGKVPNVKEILELNGVKYYLTSCDMVKNKLVEIV